MQQVIECFESTLNDLSTLTRTQLYEAVGSSDIDSVRFLLNQNGMTSVNTLCLFEFEDEDEEEDVEEPGYESPLRYAERLVEEGTNDEGVEAAEVAKRIQIVELLVASGGVAILQTSAQYLLEHPAEVDVEENDGDDE